MKVPNQGEVTLSVTVQMEVTLNVRAQMEVTLSVRAQMKKWQSMELGSSNEEILIPGKWTELNIHNMLTRGTF